jgi:hypothetical protein
MDRRAFFLRLVSGAIPVHAPASSSCCVVICRNDPADPRRSARYSALLELARDMEARDQTLVMEDARPRANGCPH